MAKILKIICSCSNWRCDKIVYDLLTTIIESEVRAFLITIYFQAADSCKSGKKRSITTQKCFAGVSKTNLSAFSILDHFSVFVFFFRLLNLFCVFFFALASPYVYKLTNEMENGDYKFV